MSDDPFDDLGPETLGGDGPGGDGPGLPDDAVLAAQITEAAQLPLHDDGNGRRLALYFGEDLMFVPRVGWFSWTGQVWAADPDDIEVRRRSQQLAGLIWRESAALRLTNWQAHLVAEERRLRADMAAYEVIEGGALSPEAEAAVRGIEAELRGVRDALKKSGDPRLAHRRFALQTGNSGRMQAARGEAEVRLAVPVEALDADGLAVNTRSGVLRFRVTTDDGFRRCEVVCDDHARADRMTKIVAARYDPDAECPAFDAFFARVVPDPEMRAFLLRWFGLSMLGVVEQKLAFLYGMGANGKSVLVDLMARILADYAATARIESLTGTNRRGGGDATPDLVPLIGARMVRAAEPDEGVKWQEGLIKDLTGGEPILVRALNKDFVTCRPVFSLTISGNHKPDIRGTDDGIWRRLLLVPFEVQIPEAEQMPKAELDATLFAEADGVFRRLVEAAADYLERGLRPPDQVTQATQEFREESDPYGSFLHDACVVTSDAADTITSRELMLAFQFWQMSQGLGAFKDRTISIGFRERSRRWVSRQGQRFTYRKSAGVSLYDGIRFTDLFARVWAAAPKDSQGRALSVPADVAREAGEGRG